MKYSFFKKIIFKLKPETAHNLAIWALKNNLVSYPKTIPYSNLENKVLGMNFENPIGMAAGFDKNAAIFANLFNFGFGFVESGTVTPKPQIGNEKPRIFRLEEDGAIINRLGFNNLGAEEFLKNIASKSLSKSQIFGINIGKNKDTQNAIEDYVLLLEKTYGKSDYITINISSPNTKNLRDLQKPDELDIFLKAIFDKKSELKNIYNKKTRNESRQTLQESPIHIFEEKMMGKDIPILLKIAPDLSAEEQEAIATIALKNKIDGLIISNTTISRPNNLQSKFQNEVGGLSGKPVLELSNQVLKNIYILTKGQIPIIAVGGIDCAQDAYEKIKLGASLVQIYSAFIYQGFELVEKIKKDLSELVKKDGFENIKDAIGILNK